MRRPYRRSAAAIARGRDPRPSPRRRGSRRDSGAPIVADDELRRDAVGLDFDDDAGRRSRCPATGAARAAFADSDGAAALPHALRARAAAARASACSSRSTASSTRPTSGSTAPTSATPRATSSRTRSTSPSLSRLGDRARAGGRGRLRAAAATARRSATSPACSSTGTARPDVEPGRPLAAGADRDDRPGAHRPLPRAVPRRQRRARPPPRCTPGSTAMRPRTVRIRTLVDGVAARRSSEQSLARGAQRGRLDPRHRRPAAVVAVVARRAAADRRRASRSSSTASSSDRRTRAHRAARGRAAATGCSRSTASGCSSRAPTSAPTRMALGEATPAELRRDVELARDAGLDLLRVHGHIAAPGAVRRRRRARHAAVAGLPAAVGLRPHASASRPCARPARRSTCSATTRRSPCGAATTSRSRVEPRSQATARRQGRVQYVAGQQLPTWNKTVLDRWVKRAFEQADDTPPGRSPTPACCRTSRSSTAPTATSTSAGTTATSATSPASPRRCRGWCGSSASSAPRRCPTTADFMRARALARPRLGAARANATACSAHAFDERRAARRATPTFDDWRDATQRVPGDGAAPPHRDAAAAQVPADRRLLLRSARRRRPDGVVERARPRAAAEARPTRRVVDACRPVIVVADRLPDTVSRRRRAGPRRPRGQRPPPAAGRRRLHGEAQLAGRLARLALGWRRAGRRLRARRHRPVRRARQAGEMWLDLIVEHGDEVATNRYVATIVR